MNSCTVDVDRMAGRAKSNSFYGPARRQEHCRGTFMKLNVFCRRIDKKESLCDEMDKVRECMKWNVRRFPSDLSRYRVKRSCVFLNIVRYALQQILTNKEIKSKWILRIFFKLLKNTSVKKGMQKLILKNSLNVKCFSNFKRLLQLLQIWNGIKISVTRYSLNRARMMV